LTMNEPITLPTAPDAEAASLACLIENPERFGPVVKLAGITPEYYAGNDTSALFGLILRRIQNGKAIDPSSLKEDIRVRKPAGLTLSAFAKILNYEFDPNAWDGYMSAIRETRAKRIIIQSAMTAEDGSGYDAVSAIRKAAEMAQDALEGSTEIYDARRATMAFFEALEERCATGDSPGEVTGVPNIDAHTGGMRKGELWVIGAKTSGGKSVLMLQMAASMIQSGKRVAIFSLELTVEEVVGRMACNLGRVEMGKITGTEKLTNGDLGRIRNVTDRLKETNFSICEQHGLSMDQIEAHCIRLQQTGGIELVLIDYLQQVEAPRIKGQNREQEVSNISRKCKQLAKRLKCPVITATQLNEAGQSRESRAIEHDADNVILIEDDKNNQGQVWIRFWKCRNGQRGYSFPAKLNGALQRFDFL